LKDFTLVALSGTLSVWLTCQTCFGIKTGAITAKVTTFKRETQPVLFWFTAFVNGILALMFLGATCYLLFVVE
jgi:hypothetical protein